MEKNVQNIIWQKSSKKSKKSGFFLIFLDGRSFYDFVEGRFFSLYLIEIEHASFLKQSYRNWKNGQDDNLFLSVPSVIFEEPLSICFLEIVRPREPFLFYKVDLYVLTPQFYHNKNIPQNFWRLWNVDERCYLFWGIIFL